VLSAAVDANVINPTLSMQHCTDMLLTFGDGLIVRAGSGQSGPSVDSLVNMIAYILGVRFDQHLSSDQRTPEEIRPDAPSARNLGVMTRQT
jgi:hypothetical protein